MANKRIRKKLSNSRQFNKTYRNTTSDVWTDDALLEAMLQCSDCAGGFSRKKFKDCMDEYEWLVDNLPTFPYVKDQYLNFLFSNGLTTGDEEKDKSLNKFLYKQNIQGMTNYDVLQQAIALSKVYGRCGIRWLSLEEGILLVPPSQYQVITIKDEEYEGFRKPFCYAISTDDKKPINLSEGYIDRDEFERYGKLGTKDWFIVTPDEFINLRNDTSVFEGKSIFENDKQRLMLLASVYTRLNYDIDYDGPGRMLFFLRDGITNLGNNEVSTGEIIRNTAGVQESRVDKAKKEIEALAKQIKESSSDSTILVSNIFKDFEHLPRVTKATDFLEWLMSKEGSIIAQCFGISASLLGLDETSGNVSMEKIIDNAMLNNVVPEREKIAIQLSPLLSSKLGFEKIYFNKYELKQQLDKSAEVYKEMLSVAQCVAMACEEGDIMAKAIMNHALATLGQKEIFDIMEPLRRYDESIRETRNENISERTDKAIKKVNEEVDVGKIR